MLPSVPSSESAESTGQSFRRFAHGQARLQQQARRHQQHLRGIVAAHALRFVVRHQDVLLLRHHQLDSWDIDGMAVDDVHPREDHHIRVVAGQAVGLRHEVPKQRHRREVLAEVLIGSSDGPCHAPLGQDLCTSSHLRAHS